VDRRQRTRRLKSHTKPRLSRMTGGAALIQTAVLSIRILREETATRPLPIHTKTNHQTRQVTIKYRAATLQAMGLNIIEKGIVRYPARSLDWWEFDTAWPSSMLFAAAKRFTGIQMNPYFSAIHDGTFELSLSQLLTVLYLCALFAENRRLKGLYGMNYPLSAVRGIAERLSIANIPDSLKMTEYCKIQQVTQLWSTPVPYALPLVRQYEFSGSTDRGEYNCATTSKLSTPLQFTPRPCSNVKSRITKNSYLQCPSDGGR
jgi:hypothetical protein